MQNETKALFQATENSGIILVFAFHSMKKVIGLTATFVRATAGTCRAWRTKCAA